jgi:hypothetical protein
MLIGFIFWYKGLAAGADLPMASSSYYSRSSGLAWRRRFCTKPSATMMLAVTLGVILCVVGSRKFGS